MPLQLPNYVLGDPRKPLVVLVSGFPDDCISGWGTRFMNELASDFFIISLCFPGFDSPSSSRPWGFDFNELVVIMHTTIHNIIDRQCLPNSQTQYELLIHDWGSYLGQLYQNSYSNEVSRACIVDVGDLWNCQWRIYMSYQFMLGLDYYISQVFGNRVGTICFWTTMISFAIFPFLVPTTHHSLEAERRPVTDMNVSMCYPYYYACIDPFFGKPLPIPKVCSCPVLYIYGEKKNTLFHSSDFVSELQRRKDGSKIIHFPRSGHWPILSEPTATLREIKLFFNH